MTKREELDLFIEKADDFTNSKYILADIKIVGLLKAIAISDTLLALFKNCLTDFDYLSAQKKYLVKSQYLGSNKGEFILPPNSRELLAFVFNLLMDIDAKNIDLADFLNKYFYVDGSYSSAYEAFINGMIKPFRNSVKMLLESVLEGKLQDPIEAFVEEEARRAKQKELDEDNRKKEEELSKKVYGESVKTVKKLLLLDKGKIKESKLSEQKKQEAILVVDMLANVIDSLDKDAIEYAFIAYKYMTKTYKLLFLGRAKKLGKYIEDVVNGL